MEAVHTYICPCITRLTSHLYLLALVLPKGALSALL